MTVMGEAVVDRLSDRGSIPLSSTKMNFRNYIRKLLKCLIYKGFGDFFVV